MSEERDSPTVYFSSLAKPLWIVTGTISVTIKFVERFLVSEH